MTTTTTHATPIENLPTIGTHNGTITIQNTESGNHRTFSVKTQKDDAKFAPGKRIVALLTGPNNEEDYQPFGFVNDDGTIHVWRKKAQHFIYNKYADMLTRPQAYTKCEYLTEGRCRVCNRKLTEPESIKSGIGPVCAGRS